MKVLRVLLLGCMVLSKIGTALAADPAESPASPHFDGVAIFCRLEAIALRKQPTDEAPSTGTIIRSGDKLIAMKRWREWIYVSLPSAQGKSEGWIKVWHVAPVAVEQDKILPDLRRILIEQDAKGEVTVTVGGDVYIDMPIAVSRNAEGKLEATLATRRNIFMSESQHYFFDIRAKDLPALSLDPKQTFTPENLMVYEIRDGKPVKVSAVDDWSSWSTTIPEDDKAFLGPTAGVSLHWHKEIIGLDQGYGFLWVEQVHLRKWAAGGWQAVPDATVKFGAKLLNTASLPDDMKVVDAGSKKSGWVPSVLVASEARVDLLKRKGIKPRSLFCAVKDSAKNEYMYVSAMGMSAQNGLRTWTPQKGDCVLLPTKESIESLKNGNRLPEGLTDPEVNRVYLFTEEGKFELLP